MVWWRGSRGGADDAVAEGLSVTPAEAAHYSDPKAIDTLNEAWRQAKTGETRTITLRSQQTS